MWIVVEVIPHLIGYISSISHSGCSDNIYLLRETSRKPVEWGKKPDTTEYAFLFDSWESHRSVHFLKLFYFWVPTAVLLSEIVFYNFMFSEGSVSLLRDETVLGPAGADVADGVPAESHHGEGEDKPGGPEGQGVEAAERQANLILPRGEGVRHVNCRDRLDQEWDDEIGGTEVGEQ